MRRKSTFPKLVSLISNSTSATGMVRLASRANRLVSPERKKLQFKFEPLFNPLKAIQNFFVLKVTWKGTLRQVFFCLMLLPFEAFVLGWSSYLVGSESEAEFLNVIGTKVYEFSSNSK
jgi:hypothetical protein